MRILYLHQYYRTPLEGGGIRSYHVARTLAALGHQVHVITTWDGPARKVTREGNVLVTYLPIRYSNDMSTRERVRAFTKFVWGSYRVARRWLPADRVFATSTPLTIGMTALLLKMLHGVPFVFEVRDTWPEAPIQLGYVKSPIYKTLLRGLEKRIYAAADALIALSPVMAEYVRHKMPGKEVHLIPNFSDKGFFKTLRRRQTYWAGEADSYHIVYAGTFGYANQVGRLLSLALEAKRLEVPVRFTLAGEGAEREQLKAFIREHNLGYTVRLLPHQSSYSVRDLLATANAAYIGFRPEPVLAGNSPNKFFDALAAGVPVLVGVTGWLADEVRQAGCGVVLADHASDLEGLQALLAANQERMRAQAEALAARYDSTRLARAVAEIVTAGVAADARVEAL